MENIISNKNDKPLSRSDAIFERYLSDFVHHYKKYTGQKIETLIFLERYYLSLSTVTISELSRRTGESSFRLRELYKSENPDLVFGKGHQIKIPIKKAIEFISKHHLHTNPACIKMMQEFEQIISQKDCMKIIETLAFHHGWGFPKWRVVF